jgi:hypothetical protein
LTQDRHTYCVHTTDDSRVHALLLLITYSSVDDLWHPISAISFHMLLPRHNHPPEDGVVPRTSDNPMFGSQGMSEAVVHANQITNTFDVEIISINITFAKSRGFSVDSVTCDWRRCFSAPTSFFGQELGYMPNVLIRSSNDSIEDAGELGEYHLANIPPASSRTMHDID